MLSEISEVKKNIGYRVKQIRNNRGMTQETLSELIGIDPSALCRIENGQTYPKINTILSIASSLDIELYILFLDDKSFSIEAMYDDMLKKIEILKKDKILFKRAYDNIVELCKNHRLNS